MRKLQATLQILGGLVIKLSRVMNVEAALGQPLGVRVPWAMLRRGRWSMAVPRPRPRKTCGIQLLLPSIVRGTGDDRKSNRVICRLFLKKGGSASFLPLQH